MIEESAIVVKTDAEYAWVQTQRKSACGQCSVNKGCGTSVFAKVLGQRFSNLRVINRINASQGDQVIIGVPESVLVKSAFMTYIQPLLLMMIFILAGQWLQQHDIIMFGTGTGIAAGLAGFITGLLLLRRFNRRIAGNAHYQPSILRLDKDKSVAVNFTATEKQSF